MHLSLISSHINYDKFKTLIVGRVMIISIIFALVFAVLDTLGVNNIGQTQAIVNYIHVLFVTPAYVLFKRKQLSLSFSAHYFLFFCFITSVSALLVADNDSFRAIWFFLSTIIVRILWQENGTLLCLSFI